MVEQVSGFTGEFFTGLRKDHLYRLFTGFFSYFFTALCKEVGGVGAFRHLTPSPGNEVGEIAEDGDARFVCVSVVRRGRSS